MRFDFLGVGNAVVDALAEADDEELAAAGLRKGGMHLVDEPKRLKLREKLATATRVPGGSAANVTYTVSLLGGSVAFIGKLGDDELGGIFTAANRRRNIALSPPPQAGETTAHCLVLVTPDAERTMQTFVAAGLNLKKEDIDLNLVKSSRMVCLEGYLYSGVAGVLEHIALAAVKAGSLVAFMLSDAGLVEQNREEMIEFLSRHADILIANEKEALALAAADDLGETVKFCRRLCEVGVVTSSERGSTVYERRRTVRIPSFAPRRLVDSTGAGDTYAAAFLHSLLGGDDIERCGVTAAKAATQVLGRVGGKPPADLAARIAACGAL